MNAALDSLFVELRDLPVLVARELDEAATEAARAAAAAAPLRTGRLRTNIYAQRPSENEFAITAAVPYATYVIFGTRYVKPNAFLQAALARELQLFDVRLAQQIGAGGP
jgi:hypothetical protein